MLRISIAVLLAIYAAPSLRAEVYPLTLFRSYNDAVPTPALMIGKINTKGTDNSISPRQILGYDARLKVVSASIDNAAKIYPGMKVYIVKRERDHSKNRAALIVAEGEIDSISETVFAGRVAQIRGQFSMVSRQHFIAVPQENKSRDGDTRSAQEYLLEAERHRAPHHVHELGLQRGLGSASHRLVVLQPDRCVLARSLAEQGVA